METRETYQNLYKPYPEVFFIPRSSIVEKIGLHFQHLCWRVLYLDLKNLFPIHIIIAKKYMNQIHIDQ